MIGYLSHHTTLQCTNAFEIQGDRHGPSRTHLLEHRVSSINILEFVKEGHASIFVTA